MNWLRYMNDALKYVEDHLMEDIETEVLAKIALTSKFHFLRSFYMLTGINLSDYIRRRRLSVAAYELITSDKKVIEIALSCGYERPEAFTKAFKKVHGITPSQARKDPSKLIAFPPMSFHITVKGEKIMEYKIVEKEAFKVTGYSISTTSKDGVNFKVIPEFWQRVMVSGQFETLMKEKITDVSYGICIDFDMDEQTFDYLIAIDGEASVKDTVIREIPKATWAVFKSVGPLPDAIQKVTQSIYSEWFPATQFKHSGGPEIEVYYEGDTSSNDYVCEVWIPVVK